MGPKKSNKPVIRKWLKAFNARDAELGASCYADDAVNLQVAIGKPLVGKAAIYDDLKDFFLHIPDNYTVASNIFEDGNWVILEWTGGGTFYASKRSKGKKIKAQGCGFFRFRNGKIVFQRGYWDKAAWDAQIKG